MAEGKKVTQNFEKSLAELEKIVTQLEQGELSLDKAIALYEKGVGCALVCEKQLSQAKLKIEEIQVGEA